MQGKKSKKVTLVIELVALLLSWSHLAKAQQPKVPRIGFVTASGPEGPNISLFRQGPQDLGYIEGKNIIVEYRYAEGKLDRIPSFVNELVQLDVDVIATGDRTVVVVAKQVTKRFLLLWSLL